MDLKIIAVSGLALIMVLAFLYIVARVTWRFVTGIYPPTQHMIKLDDKQLLELKTLICTLKKE